MASTRGFNLFDSNSWKQAAGFDPSFGDDASAAETSKMKDAMDTNSTDYGYGAVLISPNSKVWEWFNKASPELPVVRGILMEPLDLGFTSEWDSMENVSIPITNTIAGDLYGELANKAVAMGGGSPGSVWKSKKLWKKSGDLSLNLKIRVVDWDGSGVPINNAIRCVRLVISSGKTDGTGFTSNISQAHGGQVGLFNKAAGQAVGGTLNKGAVLVDGGLEAGINTFKDNAASNKKDVASPFGAGGTNLQQNIVEDIEDLTTFRNSPLPCEIRIGKYFHHMDMVITNVNLNFSKEVSQAGPLYVDITIQAVSRKIVAGIEDIGLKKIDNTVGGRVQFEGFERKTPSPVTSVPVHHMVDPGDKMSPVSSNNSGLHQDTYWGENGKIYSTNPVKKPYNFFSDFFNLPQ